MEPEAMQALWVHGGLSLAAGMVILLFPKVFFFLIGGYLVVNGGVAFFHGADPLLALAVLIGGVLIFLSPRLVAWFVAFYLFLFAVYLLVSDASWLLAIPFLVMAGLALLAPKILPALVGIFLILAGGLSVAVTFFGAG